MKTKLVLLSLALCLSILTMHVAAQDPVKIAPRAFKEKLNNDHVRVLEYHSMPGDKEAMHSHAEGVLYVVKGGKLKFTNADGTTKEVEYKAGDVFWRDALKHSVENIGTTEVQALLVETKGMKK
jgi:beta-alanine degradation protein BauB